MLVAAACGDSDDDSAGSGDSNESPGTQTSEQDYGRPGPPGESHVGDEGEPVKGGTLVYGIEADTANGWAHYRASYATSGYIPLSAISDSLFAVNDAGEIVPLLARIYPNGGADVNHFHAAGGMGFLIGQLIGIYAGTQDEDVGVEQPQGVGHPSSSADARRPYARSYGS